MSFLDRGETERALGRRLIGDISAGAMETLPDGLPLGGIHPGRRRRFFLIGHLLMLLPSLLVSLFSGWLGLVLTCAREGAPPP